MFVCPSGPSLSSSFRLKLMFSILREVIEFQDDLRKT